MIEVLLVEDNEALRRAMRAGLEATGRVRVVAEAATGDDAVAQALALEPAVVLMDVELEGSQLNGIQAAVAIRREIPRQPVVFYSVQDDDTYFRDFRESVILSHYAYVRKTNYLLPEMVVPLLRDAIDGRSFIDPEIEERVLEVRHKDATSPLALLEPNERQVAELLAQGLTNEQIAGRLGLRDGRAVSRTNGQIYTAWGLNETTTDEKVARTRAALIAHQGQLVMWDEAGVARVEDPRRPGQWVPLFET
ncbi:MAG: response regulator transcription factor [Chloroflexi bacterium]|nr:response regulator transcription factor [Chloroflexota bacterium]MBU1749871.1 response regulator transcription factor [Chloroflexota bacterium]MBU1877603.1 response regulator transcription factor [Chloroflexota bacterium]